jgi:hypothetical protein
MFAIVGLPTLLSVMSFALFFFYLFYGQRIQSFTVLRGIVRSLTRLETMRGEARGVVVDYLSQMRKAHAEEGSGGTGPRGGGGDGDSVVQQRIDGIIDYVTIPPVDMDPAGIVQKIEHLSSTSDERVRRELARLMGGSDPVSLSVAQNLVEIASGLNSMYKVVRHQYLSGRKTNSYATLAQLQMSLPQIMEQAEGLVRAAASIKEIKPLGDGVGPLVASKFIGAGAPMEKIAEDTILARTEHKGRRLIVIKAEGPMAYVGKPGIAIRKVVEGMMETPPKAIIMVDAGAKLEGEETGGVAQGIGAAIGGIGVEKFQIEEVAAKYRIPLYAVLVKEGEEDVMTTMKKEIAEGAAKAAQVVERMIEETTQEGDCVILAGIGNTLGIGQ